MNAVDWFCSVMFAIGLALLGVVMFRQAYRHGHQPTRGRR